MTGTSYYFFDWDDNIMNLDTRIVIYNEQTGEEEEVSTGEFADIAPKLGVSDGYEQYAKEYADAFRNFNDTPGVEPADQQFPQDVGRAIESGEQWRAPSWNNFVHACAHQRPVSIVTARGHSPDTIKAGVSVLVDAGLLPREPNYHTVFPVTNPAVSEALADGRTGAGDVPDLKKAAIIKSVDEAVAAHPPYAALRFGMSDDDLANVRLIIQAMSHCKNTYPALHFFVINSHQDEHVKLEVLPFEASGDTILSA